MHFDTFTGNEFLLQMLNVETSSISFCNFNQNFVYNIPLYTYLAIERPKRSKYENKK